MTANLPAVLTRLTEAFTARRKWRSLTPVERTLELALQKAFVKQGRAFLSALNHRAGVLSGRLQEAAGDVLPPDWAALFDLIAEDASLFMLPVQDAIEASLLSGAGHSMADFAIEGSFNLTNPRAAAYLEAHAAEAVAGINEATRTELQRIISTGVAEGQSYDQIAKTIKDKYAEFAVPAPQQHIRSRAHLIAVTESGNAYEVGNRAIADQLVASGLEMEKSWLTVGDGRVDVDCESNAGAGWIPLDDAYPTGHQQPTAHPACRCTQLLRRVPSRVAA